MVMSTSNRNIITKLLQKKAAGKILCSTSVLQASRDNPTPALLVSLQQYLLAVILKTTRFSSQRSGSPSSFSWYNILMRTHFQTDEKPGPVQHQSHYKKDLDILG